jgi:hypothetical protein
MPALRFHAKALMARGRWRDPPDMRNPAGDRVSGKVGTERRAYGKRVASAVGSSAIHAAIAFGLDSTAGSRYFRSGGKGFWRRTGHGPRTILTRTDRGGETLSTWRLQRLRRRVSF